MPQTNIFKTMPTPIINELSLALISMNKTEFVDMIRQRQNT